MTFAVVASAQTASTTATAEAFAVGRAAVPQFVRASVSNASHDDALLLQGFQALSNSLRQGSDPFAE